MCRYRAPEGVYRQSPEHRHHARVTSQPVPDLAAELRAHLAEPFPKSVEKGEVYGEVDAVMIDADIFGWALGVSQGGLAFCARSIAAPAGRRRVEAIAHNFSRRRTALLRAGPEDRNAGARPRISAVAARRGRSGSMRV